MVKDRICSRSRRKSKCATNEQWYL